MFARENGGDRGALRRRAGAGGARPPRWCVSARRGARARSSCSRTSSRGTSGSSSAGSASVRHTVFRVTRNCDLEIDEEEAEDLLQTIQESCGGGCAATRCASRSPATRDDGFVAMLAEALELEPRRRLPGRTGRSTSPRLMALRRRDGTPRLRDEPFRAPRPAAASRPDDLFAVIREQDVLLHHPTSRSTRRRVHRARRRRSRRPRDQADALPHRRRLARSSRRWPARPRTASR